MESFCCGLPREKTLCVGALDKSEDIPYTIHMNDNIDEKLTKDEKAVLVLITDGEDVLDYAMAKTLRKLEKLGLAHITKLIGDYPGAGRMPYFGAITKAEEAK